MTTLSSPTLTHYEPNKNGKCRHCGKSGAAHDRHGLRGVCGIKPVSQAIKEFTALHDKGSEQFGTLWLSANRDVVNEARAHGFVPENDMMLRTLLVRLAWRLCEAYESR